LTLNVKKAIEIVNKFEMIPPQGAAVGKSMSAAVKPMLGPQNQMMRTSSADKGANDTTNAGNNGRMTPTS
jgi:hypothetical protein